MISRNVTLAEFGKPEAVARLQRVEATPVGSGQICVRTKFAPINPADLNFIEGTYGTKPEVPCVPGMEGVGKIQVDERKLFWIWTHKLVHWMRMWVWSWWP